MSRTEFDEGLDAPGALRAEPEVGSDQHYRGPERLDEHSPHELLGRLIRQRSVEGEHEGRVWVGRRQEVELLLGADERFGTHLGPQ